MREDHSLTITTTIVILAHALFFVWLAFSSSWSISNYTPKQRLVTKTIQLQPKIEEAVATAQPAPKPKQIQKKVSKPKPAPTPKPKQIQKKVSNSNPTSTKKQKLLAKAQESIAKIDQSHAKMASQSSATPNKIGSLHIDTLSAEEIGYRDELVAKLKNDLRLPEEGEVKLKLTLTRAGKVVKVAVMNAQSDTNQRYLESILPSLAFPSFGNDFGSVSEYTFLLTLTNE